MAERPISNQNWQGRSFQSFGPKFRLDMNNPQMGLNGTDVYNLYAVTDNKDVCVTGLSEGGLYKIYNDQSIEIIAGQKSKGTGVDIVICGKNGDVTITAEKNGKIRIRAASVSIDADEDLSITAGKDIKLKAGGKINAKCNELSADALSGNWAPVSSTFGGIVFKGTYVGADVLGSSFGSGAL